MKFWLNILVLSTLLTAPILAPAELPFRTIEITYRAKVTEIPDTAEQIAVWLPLPASHEYQKVFDLKLSASHRYEVLYEETYGNRFLYIELKGEEAIQALKDDLPWLEFTATITRTARSTLDTKFTIHNPRGDLSRFLKPTRLIPIDGQIADEAKRTVGEEAEPLDQARLLYDHIVRTVKYDKSGEGWGRGDAVYACDVRAGNCTDFHSLFLGEARSLNIPTRFVMGFSLPEDNMEGTLTGYHCWAEFFVPAKGWVPIDASEAYKHPEKREQFFGGLDQHRIEFTVGRDISLPKSSNGVVNYSIYPHVEVDGKVADIVEHTITFNDVE
jgi:transglutaminase-like putative cysteine protease